VVGLVFRALWGPEAMVAGVVFGGLATVLQVGASALAAPKLAAGDYSGLLMRWGLGSLIRLLGVVAIPVAIVIDRKLFQPLPTAFGYVAVLLPLFFFEIRRFR
jgi:hypothetical protein